MSEEQCQTVTEVLLIEPFYGGSHKQLMDLLKSKLESSNCLLVTLTAKKWHWKARTSALQLSTAIPLQHSFKVLFASSVLNLAELVAIRQDLNSLKKIVYFHENQLVYPVRQHKDRDFQYGYNQILTCLVADVVLFNSEYNMNSFLTSINAFLRLIPDFNTRGLEPKIRPKCCVLYYPLEFPTIEEAANLSEYLHIVWPHRWEHDKGPNDFFETLMKLKEEELNFRLSVVGETFTDVPAVFESAKMALESCVLNWGYAESKDKFYEILRSADVVVSTAIHEFYGVSMLEATYCGCYPLVPNRLVYPEIYPKQCLYNTNQQLFKRLREYCKRPWLARLQREELKLDLQQFTWPELESKFCDLFTVP